MDIKSYQEFESELLQCKLCSLHTTRIQVVPGSGNIKSNVIFIGEAPGAEEDETGIPFCGRSGKLLRSLMVNAGIQPDQVFISNTIHCRPPNNRQPTDIEINTCKQYTITQIKDYIKPKLIVCVGRIAMQVYKPNFKITQEHGIIYRLLDTYDIMGIYHPAYVLRNPSVKIDLEIDLNKIKEYVL